VSEVIAGVVEQDIADAAAENDAKRRPDQEIVDVLTPHEMRRTLGEEIDIVTRLEAQAAEVRVDRNLLANALLNLALNARDAMPEGGQLTIATACGAARWAAEEGAARWPTGEEVRITFSDTGLGMTDEVRNRAFEPFFTTKPDGLGSGLGLSMVHGFVEQSGGHIEIQSAIGSGTPRRAAACSGMVIGGGAESGAAIGTGTSESPSTRDARSRCRARKVSARQVASTAAPTSSSKRWRPCRRQRFMPRPRASGWS